MTSTQIARGAFALALFSFVFAAAACVDDDPIVSGKRGPDAASPPVTVPDAATGPVISTVVPTDDVADVDAPECRHCGETLSTDTARGTLCRKNDVGGSGLSSVRLLNALVDCVCYDKCIDKCQSYCSGSKNTGQCSQCISLQCGLAFAACQGDGK